MAFKVLIAEDEEIALKHLQNALQKEGYQTAGAQNGTDAFEKIDELNKDYAEKVVDMLGGNRSKAAEVLGISRTSLWRILKEE